MLIYATTEERWRIILPRTPGIWMCLWHWVDPSHILPRHNPTAEQKEHRERVFVFYQFANILWTVMGRGMDLRSLERKKNEKKNKLGPRIMKTNPHCCQGVQAVFNQHIHIQGRCWKKGMRPSISLQSFKKTKLWIVWTSWSWMKRTIEGRGGQWPSMDQDIVFCDLKRPRWNSQPNICCSKAKCISARSKTSHMQHFMTEASSAHTVSA